MEVCYACVNGVLFVNSKVFCLCMPVMSVLC